MPAVTGPPQWFSRARDHAEALRDDLGVLLVANVKGQTRPIDDYTTDSIATEFLSTMELDDFVRGFEEAGLYCEAVIDEGGFIKWLKDGEYKFGRARPIVYNVTQNGTGPGRFSLVPGLCRLYGLPLVDSDAYASALGQHKFHSLSILERFGLPVARSWWFTKRGWFPTSPPTGLKVIAKPTVDSASVGIHHDSVFVVDHGIELRLNPLLEMFRQPFIVQEFVAGYEVEVPVVECETVRATMAVGIHLDGQRDLGDRIMVYESVFNDGYGFYDFAEMDSEAATGMKETACKAHLLLGFSGISRIDFRVSPRGHAHIMEVTCKPHLTKHTSFMHAMQSMDISYSDFLKFTIGAAALRLGERLL